MVRFVDEVKIEVRAGHGGAGSASFRREKFIPKGGPDGGDGGRGGHVILEASRDRNTLQELYLRKRIMAENGKPGAGRNRHGRDGEDIVLKVPVGTIVKDDDGRVLSDLAADGQQWIMAKGGRGGLGNSHFATSVNRAPRYAQPGEEGEAGIRYLELKSMADVGLVGLPNAGKSTLLAHISNARPKIADYPFTTLAPMLGQVFMDDGDGFVVADIPGLIEGAHEGRGLGHRFLRHIERTQVLLHLVDAAPMDGRSLSEQVREVEAELRGYGPTVWKKPRLLVINKIDALSAEQLAERQAEAERLGLSIYPISAVSGDGIPRLLRDLYTMVREQRRLHTPLSIDEDEHAGEDAA